MRYARFAPALFIALFFACAAPSSSAIREDVRAIAGARLAELTEETGEREVEELLKKPLDANSAVRVALIRNPVLRSRMAQLGLARAEILENAANNPTVEAEARFGHHGADPALELSFSQPLTELFYSARRRTAGTLELEAEKLEAAGAILALVLDVKKAVYAHQASLERLALNERVMRAEDARLLAAEALHQAGNISELEYLSERDQRERMKGAVLDARTETTHTEETLRVLLAGSTWTMAAKLPELPKVSLAAGTALEEEAAAGNIELRALEERVKAAESRLSLSKWTGVLPGIDLGVAAHRDEPGESWEFGPTLELELPLFDQSSGATAREEAALQILTEEKQAVALAVRSAARKRTAELRAAHERVLHQRDVILPLRARIVEETRAGVNAMTIGIFQLLSVEREQVEAMLEYVGARERYFAAEAELAHVLAGGRAEED
jgi:cobalt-zinc-cadmium efflux system outer membrane protein